MKKRRRPIIKGELEHYNGIFKVEDREIRLSYKEIKDSKLSGKIDVRFVFDTIIFRNVTVEGNKMERSEFIDCVFYNCNITNNSFVSSTFVRCEFYDSKLDGTHFVESYLEHILFSKVSGKLLDVADCKIKFLEVKDSSFVESNWFNNTLNNISFKNIDLTKADFYETKLKDVDLSSSVIEGMKIDLDGIKGATIASEQAVLLCQLIGVNVRK